MKFRLVIAAAISAFFAVPSAMAEERDDPFGSIYASYDFSTFVRGGVSFAGNGPDTTKMSPYGSIGGALPIYDGAAIRVSLEGEALIQRQRFDAFNPSGAFLTDYQRWAFAALFGARVDYTGIAHVTPFASFGAGPAYVDAVPQILDAVDPNIVLLDAIEDSLQVAYSGRAGVEFYLGEGFGIEAAYRYVGFASSPTTGFHSAELGVNRRF
ncbi:MAG: outer membrane beta-barrel protein [Alphaproteobacteria bacterium]|nr:outer membrane beta-barrel protein [Alphaproteobacteria bacterium]